MKQRKWFGVIAIWLSVLLAGCSQQSANNQLPDKGIALPANPAQILRHGPAPHYLNMAITPQLQEYKRGDNIKFTVTLTNVWEEALHIKNNPDILIGPATVNTNEYNAIAIPDLGNKTLEPGETFSTSATWKQSGRPGLYQVQFGDIDLGDTRLSGGGSRFFVQYPVGSVLTKTVDSGVELKLPTENGDLTFVLKNVAMDEHETRIEFEFRTDLEAPMGFQIAIAGAQGNIHPFAVEQSQPQKGMIKGTAKFDPTLKESTRLHIVISDWSVIHTGVSTEIVKGPWTIDVPI